MLHAAVQRMGAPVGSGQAGGGARWCVRGHGRGPAWMVSTLPPPPPPHRPRTLTLGAQHGITWARLHRPVGAKRAGRPTRHTTGRDSCQGQLLSQAGDATALGWGCYCLRWGPLLPLRNRSRYCPRLPQACCCLRLAAASGRGCYCLCQCLLVPQASARACYCQPSR